MTTATLSPVAPPGGPLPRLLHAGMERPARRDAAPRDVSAPAGRERPQPPRRLPWDDPYATAPPPILLACSQFAAQQLAQEALPEERGETPQHHLVGIAAYRRHLPEAVIVIGPAAAAGDVV